MIEAVIEALVIGIMKLLVVVVAVALVVGMGLGVAVAIWALGR